MTIFLEQNPTVAKITVEKSVTGPESKRSREKGKRSDKKENQHLKGSSLPGKLADCSDKDPANCEIYIVEGDSAGGSAKTAREPGDTGDSSSERQDSECGKSTS